jgi:anti-sigma factor RsiW
MNCNDLDNLIPLYAYGELTPEQEEQVEDHLHRCARCAGELEQHRRMAAALDRRQAAPSDAMLADCRRDLLMADYREQARAARPPQGVWQSLSASLAAAWSGLWRLRQPVGALALLAVGFFAARFTGPSSAVPVPAPGLNDEAFATVRSVQPDASGKVQIAFDETRRRSVSGRPTDDHIQKLLLAAARDDNNAAVRVESVGLLKGLPGSDEIRGALLHAIASDPNAGVRLRALEGLKPSASDPQVRKTLAQVLLTDDNPAVRMQVIDLLVEHRDNSIVGILQSVVQKEDNNYVRLKCEKALKDWNASIGTF